MHDTLHISFHLPGSRQEVKEWSKIMLERMADLKPLVLCFNGKGIYEVYSGKKCQVGIQDERLPGTDTVCWWVGEVNSLPCPAPSPTSPTLRLCM